MTPYGKYRGATRDRFAGLSAPGTCMRCAPTPTPPGDIPKVLEAWAKAVPAREELSPLAASWTSELGGLNKFVHTWVYKDLGERARIREASVSQAVRGRRKAECGLLRLLPAGAVAGWGLHPLESAALSRRTP
jgi:hypothetical protein